MKIPIEHVLPNIIVFKMTQLRQATREEMIMTPYTKSGKQKQETSYKNFVFINSDITSNGIYQKDLFK